MISKAKEVLVENGCTCVVIKGEFCFESKQRGVKPLLALIDGENDVCGGVAADKVIGKAAAFLYILLGVKEIYADVISEPAIEILRKDGISVEYRERVPMIRNRDGSGFCPMEQATLKVEDEKIALEVIRETLRSLTKNN